MIEEIKPDSNTVLLDNFNGTTKGAGFGELTYEDSIPTLGQAVSLQKGVYIKYAFSPWYRWDGVHKWDRNEAAPWVLTEGTIEMWIKPRQYSIGILTFNWYDTASSPSSGYILTLGLNPEGKLVYNVWGGWCGTNKIPAGKTVLPLNKWTHIAVSWGPGGTKLYVNGQVDAYSEANVWTAFWGTPCYAYLNDWGRSDLGLIDELHISKVARTDEEIRSRVPPASAIAIVEPPSPTKQTPLTLTGRAEAKPTKIPVNIALNKERSGYPSPLETATGYCTEYGKWWLVDSVTNPAGYWEGVAFTYSESSFQHITLDFGKPKTFNQIEVWDSQGGPNLWYRGENKKVEYWDGSNWIEIVGGSWSLQQISYYENPVIYSFSPVTATKVRFSCIPKDWIWVSEFRVLTTEEIMPDGQVFVNGVAQRRVKVNRDGSFSIDVDLNEGENKIAVRLIDASGNTIDESQPIVVVLDTIPPEPPVLKPLPSTTADPNITIKGNAEPNSDVELFVNGVFRGTTKTDVNADFALAGRLDEGMNEITARARDFAGNTSKFSSPVFVLYQIQPLANLPVINIAGVGDIHATKLEGYGLKTIRDMVLADVIALNRKTGISLVTLYTWKRKAEMAKDIKIDRTLFSSILKMRLGDIIAMPDEELCRKANLPIKIISDLKKDISTLLISLDNTIVRPMTLERLAV